MKIKVGDIVVILENEMTLNNVVLTKGKKAIVLEVCNDGTLLVKELFDPFRDDSWYTAPNNVMVVALI